MQCLDGIAMTQPLGGHAASEARRLGQDCIGPEHLLLGLVAMGDGTVGRLFEEAGIVPAEVTRALEAALASGGKPVPPGQLPFTPRAKRALQRALALANERGRPEVGTDLLLLAILEDDNSLASEVLGHLGFDLRWARARVLGGPPCPPASEK
jgi:ATP-dependent Clp protease ATP-binding subunit ClpC